MRVLVLSVSLALCAWTSDVTAQTTVVTKRCGNCGQPVSETASVGDRCPHCGIIWGREKTARPTIENGANGTAGASGTNGTSGTSGTSGAVGAEVHQATGASQQPTPEGGLPNLLPLFIVGLLALGVGGAIWIMRGEAGRRQPAVRRRYPQRRRR